MLERLPRRGVVVPQILDGEGRITHSIRREPALGRALGDALLASRWKRRPDWLAETVYARHQYESAHRIDWATGAALLIDAKLAGELGPWDERYFLFSEETDYLRRARDAGASVWFEPAARIVHREGGSGRSPELNALSAVNRIRYIRAFHGRLYAAAFRSIAILAETVRLGRPGNAGALRMVTSEGRWRSLPHAPDRPSDRPTFGYLVPEFPGQTHAFFWREITALRNAGASPRLISTRPPRRALVPHSWASEAASETYYLGSLRLADVPRTTLALARSFRAGLPPFEARGVRGRLRMFVLRVAGSRLAVLARREGWSHVHVHSCGDSARIAAFARAAGGPSYSLTLHGPLSDYGGDQETKWSGAEFGLVITDRLKGEVMGALGDAVRTEPAIAPMGIDPEVFRPRVPEAPRPSHAPASIRIVSCGRLNPSKGHEVLIAAVIRLRDQGRDVTLDIAGEDDDGGTGYRRRLESIIGREHLTEAVTLHGAISERGVVDLLDDATVFALASRAEPLGVAIMEAMAVGVPVVAGNGGGVAELIDDGRTGILAAPGDPEAFAAAIARIADTPELAAALAGRAREAVLARFDSRASAATLLSLVETSGRAA
jgi:glycosyltransferase involved in cell wall biosynthesis